MALNNYDKNLLIATMERSLNDAKEAADISALSDIETAVGALRTAYDSDPTTVTADAIVAAANKVMLCVFPSMTSIRTVLQEAEAEAES
jgi:hypothetical protein